MKILSSITRLFGVALCCSSALAQDEAGKYDKIGTVDMVRLVGDYYKTAETRDSFKGYEERLTTADKKKVEEISVLMEESKKLQAQADDPNITSEARGEIFREASIKKQKAEFLQKNRVEWAQQKQAAFNDKINVELAKHRKEIIAEIQAVAKKEGYDFIFDRSGSSGAGVPILTYTKDASDLTGYFLELINKDAPEKEPEDGE